MSGELVNAVVSTVTAIIGLAVLSVILSNKATTVPLVDALSKGLANDINAATSPVTGGSGFGEVTPTVQYA